MVQRFYYGSDVLGFAAKKLPQANQQGLGSKYMDISGKQAKVKLNTFISLMKNYLDNRFLLSYLANSHC